jgi:hypothetical protein
MTVKVIVEKPVISLMEPSDLIKRAVSESASRVRTTVPQRTGLIVLDSIVATQILASSYRFHPALGLNLFHIYPLWSYFVWSQQWEQANNYTLFASVLW